MQTLSKNLFLNILFSNIRFGGYERWWLCHRLYDFETANLLAILKQVLHNRLFSRFNNSDYNTINLNIEKAQQIL